MVFDPRFQRRRSLRLRSYRYSWTGSYFVTICAHQRQCLFGEVIDGRMLLNEAGQVIEEEWRRTPSLRPSVHLDSFVVMPNHFHGILRISPPPEDVGATCGRPGWVDGRQGPDPKSLGAVLAGFKAACTKRIRLLKPDYESPAWQRNYFERIVRNEEELMAMRWYIQNNPAAWDQDEENPEQTR